jgi:hypothetical protein
MRTQQDRRITRYKFLLLTVPRFEFILLTGRPALSATNFAMVKPHRET